MRIFVLKLLAKQVVKNAFGNKAVLVLSSIMVLLLVYAAITGLAMYKKQTASQLRFQKEVRANWEKMPDKHPHRMAHYGYIVFRPKNPLSFFDFGIESYTGNAIFLEAHRQNTVNFSEAGFSTGLLRFGEISIAMILQVLLPLVLFFIGFSAVAADRENGTLKLLLSQGTSWKEIIVGKSIGLTGVALCFFVPAAILLIIGRALSPAEETIKYEALSVLGLTLSYIIYLGIISTMAIIVSAICRQANVALVALIGIWLLFGIMLPRATQAVGNYMYPSPTKIEFETAIENDLLKEGDSHDPNDAHYKKLKDSVLLANGVDAVEKLPFNYGGFQMKEGEKISAGLYNQHLVALTDVYQQQNNLSRLSAFINPFAAIRNLSMAFCGTDFNSYVLFQQQAEQYRYRLAQHMNDLQIQFISNKKLADTAHPYSISSQYWKDFPDFRYEKNSKYEVPGNEAISIAALLFCVVLLVIIIQWLSKKLKAV